MKKCPNCGHELEDNERYCPACGAMCPTGDTPAPETPENEPVNDPTPQPEAPENQPEGAPVAPPEAPEAPAAPETPVVPPTAGYAYGQSVTPEVPQPKSKKGLIIGIAAAVVAVACIGVGVAMMLGGGRGTQLTGSPAEQFKTILTTGVDKAFDSLEETAGAEAAENYSNELVITAQGGGAQVAPYLEGSSIGLQVDTKKDSFLMGMDFTFNNIPIISGMLTYEDNVMGLCVPELADSWYVMDLERLLEKTYGEAGMEYMPQLTVTTPTDTAKALRKVTDSLMDALLIGVKDDNVTLAEGSFTLYSGAKEKGDIYTYKPTAEDWEATILALADWLESEETRSFMTEYGGVSGEDAEELAATAAEMRAGAAETAAMAEEEGLCLTLARGGKTAQVVLDYAEGRILAETAEKSFTLDISDDKTSIIYVQVTDHDISALIHDEKGGNVTLTGTYKEVEKGVYSGTLQMDMGGEVGLLFAFDSMDTGHKMGDMPYGHYEMTMAMQGQEMTIYFDVTGSQGGGSDLAIHFSAPALDTAEFELSTLVINIHSTDKPSSITAPISPQVDVTDYTEEDFNALGEELSDAAMGLLFKLMSAVYS